MHTGFFFFNWPEEGGGEFCELGGKECGEDDDGSDDDGGDSVFW